MWKVSLNFLRFESWRKAMYSVANQNSYTVFPNQEKNVPNSDMDPTFQHLNINIKTKLQQNIKKTMLDDQPMVGSGYASQKWLANGFGSPQHWWMESLPMKMRKRPQWSLSRTVERSIVKAGDEKKMAVASPSGRLRTACNNRENGQQKAAHRLQQ